MKNWQTTVSGIGTALTALLTALAALPYSLGDIATIIPADAKAKVFTAAAIATCILKVWNAFAAADAKQLSDLNITIPATKAASVILIGVLALGMTGCSGVQALFSSKNVTSLESGFEAIVQQEWENAWNNYVSTGKVDLSGDLKYAASDALRTIEGTSQITSASAIQSILTSWGIPQVIAQEVAPDIATAASQLISRGLNSVQALETSATAIEGSSSPATP